MDSNVWQRLLEFGDSRVGDLGVVEVEELQTRQSLQLHESRVGDLGAGKRCHPSRSGSGL